MPSSNGTISPLLCEADADFLNFLYAITYTIILVPGLIGNILALWLFYAYIKETKRAVIFMINLAIADLAQVLSLPLRIFYYLNHSWPFGEVLCMFCFYLKYVNMYASIYFLVCISIRRLLFLLYPFRYSDCRRTYDVYISFAGWIVVFAACLPFPLLRLDSDNNQTCFVDLPLKNIGTVNSIMMMTLGELFGFVTPLVTVLYCSWKTIYLLKETNSISHDLGEKKKALKMILTCTVVFLICFAPYHISFPLHYLAKSSQISDCSSRKAILTFHPVALCLASMNSCLDPIIYYFTTDEFKRRLSRQDSMELHNKDTVKKQLKAEQ
ncbi:putative G-protein coupled receptor 174 [Microcaecilia unicolor]|uniref:Probable G-protein coupled receptor 174 n=1 Tax=Microcaecilia unicolor TaxID=1415580 RepID=A0A6P7YG49_9AMPH|nr:probable G-protein coupled receptor 174 [Microcaecilia unicolor]